MIVCEGTRKPGSTVVDGGVRQGALQQVKLAVVALAAVLALCAPALAQSGSAGAGQSSAGSQQYSGESGLPSVPSLTDGVQDAADNAGQGANAANDALSGARTSDGKVAGLTELPDTGGAPLFLPVAGALLVGAGLLSRRIIR